MLNLSRYIENDLNIDLDRFKEIAKLEEMPDLDNFTKDFFGCLQKVITKKYIIEAFTDEQKDVISIFFGYYKALSMNLKIHAIPKHATSSHTAATEAQKLLEKLSQTGINHISFNLKETKPIQITDKLTLTYILKAIYPILQDRAQAPRGGKKRSYAKEYCQQLAPFFNYLITETYMGGNNKIDVTKWILELVGFKWVDDEELLLKHLERSKAARLSIKNI